MLFGTNYSRYELYKLECERFADLPVIVSVAHNNATKLPVPVIKELKPVAQLQPEAAPAAAEVAAEPAALAA